MATLMDSRCESRVWEEVLRRYPNEEEGEEGEGGSEWMMSFAMDDAEGIRDALEIYGMAVVNLLTEEEADATAEEALEDASVRAAAVREHETEPIRLDDPNTWKTSNWPRDQKFLFDAPAFTPCAFANRAKAYPVFRDLFGVDELWSSIDNWGVLRGTSGLSLVNPESGEVEEGVEKPEWRHSLAAHWDCNPYRVIEYERPQGLPQRYQGLVALTDCPVSTGTFAIVPGSAAFLPTWVAEHPRKSKRSQAEPSRKSVRPKKTDPMVAHMQAIPLRKGQLVIFRQEALHANVPNTDANMRLVQFIRFMPASEYSCDVDKYAPPRVWAQYGGERERVLEFVSSDQRPLFGLSDPDQ